VAEDGRQWMFEVVECSLVGDKVCPRRGISSGIACESVHCIEYYLTDTSSKEKESLLRVSLVPQAPSALSSTQSHATERERRRIRRRRYPWPLSCVATTSQATLHQHRDLPLLQSTKRIYHHCDHPTSSSICDPPFRQQHTQRHTITSAICALRL